MKCSKCENDGRYLRADGKFYCSLHAMGHFALRLSDIGVVLDDVYMLVVSDYESLSRMGKLHYDEARERLRVILGMLPQNCQTVEIRSTDDDRSP